MDSLAHLRYCRRLLSTIVTVVVPTLTADSALDECLQSLSAQTQDGVEVVVVDNSGCGLVGSRAGAHRVIRNAVNVGFGTAINQGMRDTEAPFVATLNDDACAGSGWLAAMVNAMQSRPDVGMCASQVRLSPSGALDSAGMLLCADGSSVQRGHGHEPHAFAKVEEALLPSGSAALYRRAMLDEIGGFDDDFFLYCEDTDIGLRARRAGWRCLYVPDAVVQHRYSHSAGRASALKAYYVERNRLFVTVKNFPLTLLLRVPFVSAARYLWHLWYLSRGRGAAAEFREAGSGLALAYFVIKAHLATLVNLPALLKKRRQVQKHARLPSADFHRLLRQYSISARQVAAH